MHFFLFSQSFTAPHFVIYFYFHIYFSFIFVQKVFMLAIMMTCMVIVAIGSCSIAYCKLSVPICMFVCILISDFVSSFSQETIGKVEIAENLMEGCFVVMLWIITNFIYNYLKSLL